MTYSNQSASASLSTAALQEQLTQALSYIAHLEQVNKELEAQVSALSINPNFGVATRIAGLERAERVIKEERRKDSSSPIALVTIDIGGMGNSNSSRGEVATNEAMTSLLIDIREQFRDILLSDGQLNSGDEFLFWLSARVDDLPGVMGRLDSLSKKWGFEGAYCGSIQVPTNSQLGRQDLVDLANEGMEQVYPEKKRIKEANLLALQKAREHLADLGGVGFSF